MSNISRLEKISLLTLVQGAKYYPITRQENLEFLGEIDGGAKTTSNSGVISFEYMEIWERLARYVSSLTNKQTKWMKYQVIGNQIKEEKFEICIKSVYGYERRRERKEKKKKKSWNHVVSVNFEWFPANPSQILPTFCQDNKVKPWKFERKKKYQNYRSFDERERKKGRPKNWSYSLAVSRITNKRTNET